MHSISIFANGYSVTSSDDKNTLFLKLFTRVPDMREDGTIGGMIDHDTVHAIIPVDLAEDLYNAIDRYLHGI